MRHSQAALYRFSLALHADRGIDRHQETPGPFPTVLAVHVQQCPAAPAPGDGAGAAGVSAKLRVNRDGSLAGFSLRRHVDRHSIQGRFECNEEYAGDVADAGAFVRHPGGSIGIGTGAQNGRLLAVVCDVQLA